MVDNPSDVRIGSFASFGRYTHVFRSSPEADIVAPGRHVSKVPEDDIAARLRNVLVRHRSVRLTLHLGATFRSRHQPSDGRRAPLAFP